jgi:hypothetical protein
MKLTIGNKKQFISNILGSASSISDKATFRIETDKISALLASNDQTLVLYAELPAICESVVKLNVPDIKKFTRVLDCVNDEESDKIDLTLESNCIKYTTPHYKFKYHLLDDGIIKEPLINIKKINDIVFDTSFVVQAEVINNITRASSFTTETNKIYIYCEDNKVFAELGDKTRHNSDNFQMVISDKLEGSTISKPLPINFETFRLVNFSKSDACKVSINNTLGILKIDMKRGDTKLIYIVSALIN